VGQSAVVKFVVDEAGKISQFSYVSGPGDPRIPGAISSSIESCSWTPGANEQGRPVAVWVTMPISFGQ
jgi:protein TonB